MLTSKPSFMLPGTRIASRTLVKRADTDTRLYPNFDRNEMPGLGALVVFDSDEEEDLMDSSH